MRKTWQIPALVLLAAGVAGASTTITDYLIKRATITNSAFTNGSVNASTMSADAFDSGAVTNSPVDGSPLGSHAASSVNASSHALNGGAPTGHTLCGNGSTYVDAATCGGVAGSISYPNRPMGQTYTNGMGAALFVSGNASTSGSGTGTIHCRVDGNTVFQDSATATVNGGAKGFSFVVPAGSTYGCTTDGAVGGTVVWAEVVLR